MTIIAIILIASQSWGRQGSLEGTTWKCYKNLGCWKKIGSVKNTGKTTRSTWIETRYDGYPGYYTRTLEEADCAKGVAEGREYKGLERQIQGNTYANDGTLVKSWKKNNKPYYKEFQGKTYKLDGWMHVPKTYDIGDQIPLYDIFDAICGE